MNTVWKRVGHEPRRKSYLVVGLWLFGGAGAFYLSTSPIGSTQLWASFSPTSEEKYVVKLNDAIGPLVSGHINCIIRRSVLTGGLSVQLLNGSGDADAISSVAANDHVIGLASAQAFLEARAEGAPIVAFAASYTVSAVEFFALSNTRLLAPSDLEGTRIGYNAKSEVSTILQAFIAKIR
jgi:hypothetical protein